MDWGAIAVFAILYGAVFVSARQGYQSPDALHRAYKDDRAVTREAITTDKVLAELVSLVSEVNRRTSRAPNTTRTLLNEAEIQKTLDSIGFLDRVATLSRFYVDFTRIDLLLGVAKRWARRKASCSLLFGAVLLPLLLQLGFSVEVQTWLLIAAIALSVGFASSAIVCWRQEALSRNKLSELFAIYA